MVKYFEPYVIKFCSSVEECEQICASEIIAGLVKGSRFWSYEPTNRIWSKIIIPAFKEVFAKVTTETLHDWEDCLKYGIKKTDPNRIHWLFNLFLDYLENNFSASIDSSGAGAFNQSSFLKLFRKVSKELKWKLRELYAQIFSNLKQITSHPYHMVRKEISGFLVTLLSLDIKYDGETGGQEDMFPGFPKVRQYLDEILPILNDEKMPLTPIDVKNANTILDDHEASRKIFKDTYHKVLETVAIWIEEYINCTFITFPKDIYEILPILCQFVEDEEIYKQCLKTLSFWSISIVPHNDLSHVLEIIWKIMATSADSRKAKLNCLNFLQKFLSSNFMSLCFDEKLVCQIETQILSFMSDPTIQVREKASKICSGLVHWGFFNQDVVKNKLLKKFQAKISHDFVLHKMIEAVQFKKQTSIKSKKHQSSNILEDCDELATYHSGILGLCAIVEAHPYNVPDYVPGLLMELVRHLHDPQPIPKTIKNTFQEFKRTHQDNWQEHKLKFSDHELIVLNDLLVSPNYYA
jgi:proteasome activator subunit 4